MPKDVLRRDISPAAKLVFAVIAAEMYDRKTVEMTHEEIGACCHIAARHVKRSLKVLVAEGLVEQRRLSAGRVHQYRLLHAEFGSVSKAEPATAEKPAERVAAERVPRWPVRRATSSAGACTGPAFAAAARRTSIWRRRCARCGRNWGQTHRPSRSRSAWRGLPLTVCSAA